MLYSVELVNWPTPNVSFTFCCIWLKNWTDSNVGFVFSFNFSWSPPLNLLHLVLVPYSNHPNVWLIIYIDKPRIRSMCTNHEDQDSWQDRMLWNQILKFYHLLSIWSYEHHQNSTFFERDYILCMPRNNYPRTDHFLIVNRRRKKVPFRIHFVRLNDEYEEGNSVWILVYLLALIIHQFSYSHL